MNKHAIAEGLKNIIRTFWLSITAISVLIVSIGSVALVITMRSSMDFTLRQLDNQLSIVVYFVEDVDEKTIQDVQGEIKSLPSVEKVKYVNKDEAREDLDITEETIASLDGQNPLLDSIWINPTEVEKYNDIVEVLKSSKYDNIFDSIEDDQKVIEELKNIYKWTGFIGFSLIVVFIIISVLVMVNILRMSIYNYRSEIEIMRLVGATNKYIQQPFIVQGVLFNLIASIFISAAFLPFINYVLAPRLQGWLTISNDDIEVKNLIFDIYSNLFIVFISSLLVGGFASYFATKKYLKL